MLTEIKPDTNVPTNKEVVAFNVSGDSLIGVLEFSLKHSPDLMANKVVAENCWICTDQDSRSKLFDVKYFITTENLFKAK